jgi:glc operon protein GlcG
MPLSLPECRAAFDASFHYAEGQGVCIAMAILDEGGHLIALERMPGAFPISSEIAIAKASAAALWYRDGDSLAVLASDRPDMYAGVGRLMSRPLIPARGSVVIRRGLSVLGGVGVSGAPSDVDLKCARVGLREIQCDLSASKDVGGRE